MSVYKRKSAKQLAEESRETPKPKVIPRFKQNVGQTDTIIILDKKFDPDQEDCGLWAVAEYKSVGTGEFHPTRNFEYTKDVWFQSAKSYGVSCIAADGRLSKAFGGNGTVSKLQTNVYTSIIHISPKDKDGKPHTYYKDDNYGHKKGEIRKYAKCLMPMQYGVSSSNINAILKVLKKAYWEINPQTGKPYKSIYGVMLRLKRSDEQMSATVGEPVEFELKQGQEGVGPEWKRLPEKYLLEKFGHKAFKNKEGKVYKEANSDIEPFDYDVVFAPMSEKEACEKYGIPYTPPAGSGDNDVYDQELEDQEFDYGDFDDDIPFDDSSSNDTDQTSVDTGDEFDGLDFEDFDDMPEEEDSPTISDDNDDNDELPNFDDMDDNIPF